MDVFRLDMEKIYPVYQKINGKTGSVITLFGTDILIAEGSVQTVKQAIDNKATVYQSGTAPTSPVTGDLWLDTTNSVLKRYNGSTWDNIGSSSNVTMTDNQSGGVDLTVDSTTRTLAKETELSSVSGRVTTIEGKEPGWDAKYTKPSGGIPKTDIASNVLTMVVNVTTNEEEELVADKTLAEILTAISNGLPIVCRTEMELPDFLLYAYDDNSITFFSAITAIMDGSPIVLSALMQMDGDGITLTDNSYSVQKLIAQQTSAPSSPSTGDLWIDTNGTVPVLKRYDGTSFVRVGIVLDSTPTSGSNNGVTSDGVYNAVSGKYTKPSSGIPASDLASGVIPDISSKLTEPSTFSVGKFFRVASVDGSGHPVLEAVDAPTTPMKVKLAGTAQTPDADGYIAIPAFGGWNSYGIPKYMYNKGIYSDNGVICTDNASPTYDFSPRANNNKVISINNLDFAVKRAMTDGIGTAWTDAEKTGAWSRLNSIKTTLDAVAVAGASYYLGQQSTVSVVLPSSPLTGQSINVVFYSGATATTLTVTGTIIGTAPTPAVNQRIEMSFLWDGTAWCLVSKVDAYVA